MVYLVPTCVAFLPLNLPYVCFKGTCINFCKTGWLEMPTAPCTANRTCSFQMVVVDGVNQRYGKTREFNEIQKDIFKMTYFLIRYCTEQNNIFKVFVTDQDPRTLQRSRPKYLASLKYQNITWKKPFIPSRVVKPSPCHVGRRRSSAASLVK